MTSELIVSVLQRGHECGGFARQSTELQEEVRLFYGPLVEVFCMAKKKDQLCPYGRFLAQGTVCHCFGCKIDSLRNRPEELVKAGELVEIINHLIREIDDVRSDIPREYDPQCD